MRSLVTPAGPAHATATAIPRCAGRLSCGRPAIASACRWRGRPTRLPTRCSRCTRRSHASIKGFPREKPLVLALTGTDVYRDIHESAEARESLELADRLIVLQPKAAEELPARLRRKVGVVVQSSSTGLRQRAVKGSFRVCVIGHLRAEKDPLRILSALEFVPPSFPPGRPSRRGARSRPGSENDDPRYRWLGSVPHARALKWLASSHVMVISSRMEGGAT